MEVYQFWCMRRFVECINKLAVILKKMKNITIFFLLIPLFIFSQNRENIFLVVYPSNIKINTELVNESVEYLNYEKNRSRNNADEKINDKLKSEIDSLTIEKIIGNVTLQTLQYYFFEKQPKNKYQVKFNKENKTIEELTENVKADFLVSYTDLHIYLNENGMLKFKFKLNFYDIKNKKNLLQNDYEADENNEGGMWGCSESRFKCIVNNTLRIGTEEVAKKYWNK